MSLVPCDNRAAWAELANKKMKPMEGGMDSAHRCVCETPAEVE